MVWLSINPDAEPRSSVEVVAHHYCIEPGQVTPLLMAHYYNHFVDPTVCNLSVTDRVVCEAGRFKQQIRLQQVQRNQEEFNG